MSELLEGLCEFLADLVFSLLDLWLGFRFAFAALGSLGIVALVNALVSNTPVRCLVSIPVLLAGVVGGAIWEMRNG